MNKKIFFRKRFNNAIVCIFYCLIFLSCETQDKWTIKKQEFDKTESYNYSEYISGELDSISKSHLEGSKQALQQQNRLKSKPKLKKNSEKNNPENPQKPSILKKIWRSISDLMDSVLSLL